MPTIAEVREKYPQYKDMSDDALAGALHSKFYPDMERSAFNEKIGLNPEKAEARKEYEDLKAKGVPVEPSLTRRVAHGLTLGASDEILAATQTPIEMIRKGTLNPAEGYRSAKAWQDVQMEEARKNQGVLGHIAEIGGGLGSGVGLARAGLTLARPGAGFLGRTGALAGEGAAYGGTTGFLDAGNSLDERLKGGAQGAAIGGAIGGALPLAGAAVGTAAAPFISNVRARINPQGTAASQVARALDESGRPVSDVVGDVVTAAAEGQPMYTIADALGNSGQRMLSTVTRAPGPGRTSAVEFLDQRQAGQGRRVANALAEGFDAPQTAAQTETKLTRARNDAADVNYQAARDQAGSVNVTPAIEAIDANLTPGVNRVISNPSGIADNSIEGALRRAKSYLTDGQSQVSDFQSAFMAKRELDAMIETASPTIQRALIPVRTALDKQLASSSQPYRAARDQFSRESKSIGAIEEGRTATMRGRTEDTIPAFRGMGADQQAGFRVGYVDPLIAQTQGGAQGVNASRPFTSQAFRDEAAVMAPGNPMMTRRLDREGRMFETRNHATGNSRTADNLADQEAMKVDPSVVVSLLTGNIGAAAKQAYGHATNALHGYTPAVREAIAGLLLQRGANPTLSNDIAKQMSRLTRNRDIAAALSRGGLSAGNVAALPAYRK